MKQYLRHLKMVKVIPLRFQIFRDVSPKEINLAEAIEGTGCRIWLILGELEDGHSFPRPSISSSITIPEGSFANFLVLDIDAYSEPIWD